MSSFDCGVPNSYLALNYGSTSGASTVLSGGGTSASAIVTQAFTPVRALNYVSMVAVLNNPAASCDIRMTIFQNIFNNATSISVPIATATVFGTVNRASTLDKGLILTISNIGSTAEQSTSADPLLYNNSTFTATDNLGVTVAVNLRPLDSYNGVGRIPPTFRIVVQNLDASTSLTFSKINFIFG